MKTVTVKELMVPLAQYATVSEDATLLEAVIALKKAQEGFDQTRYRHRAIDSWLCYNLGGHSLPSPK